MALYENGGVTKMAESNATNAQKAKVYDDMVAARKAQDAYDLGAKDGEQVGIQRAVEEQILRQQAQQTPRHGLNSIIYPSDQSIDRFIEFGKKLRERLGLPPQGPSFDNRDQLQRDIDNFIE